MASRSVVLALLAVSFAAVIPAAAQAEGGDAARGAKLAYTCYGCHGIPDYRNAYPNYHVPRIGGQHEGYLIAALTEYKNGSRPHPTMRGQAGSLSDQDIKDLAAHFSTKDPVKSDNQPTGKAPEKAQVCAACHGSDGVGLITDYPTISGQQRDYLVHSLQDYRTGKRQNAIMQGFAAQLTDEDIEALADYFSLQTPRLWVPRPDGEKK
jgi:cytochrome c553